MLLILIFALIASIQFARTARAKGCDVRKPRRFPWVVALVALAGGFLFIQLADFLLRTLHASDHVRGFFSWAANFFFVLAYLAVIGRAWKSLRALPDRS